jgi:alcohol dehydrogenase
MSVDALGNPDTFSNSIACLKKRGRHIQIGIITGDDANPAISMDDILYKELRIIGSYGMQAYQYPVLLRQIISGKLQPQKLVTSRVGLDEVTGVLQSMDKYENIGITVIDSF